MLSTYNCCVDKINKIRWKMCVYVARASGCLWDVLCLVTFQKINTHIYHTWYLVCWCRDDTSTHQHAKRVTVHSLARSRPRWKIWCCWFWSINLRVFNHFECSLEWIVFCGNLRCFLLFAFSHFYLSCCGCLVLNNTHSPCRSIERRVTIVELHHLACNA